MEVLEAQDLQVSYAKGIQSLTNIFAVERHRFSIFKCNYKWKSILQNWKHIPNRCPYSVNNIPSLTLRIPHPLKMLNSAIEIKEQVKTLQMLHISKIIHQQNTWIITCQSWRDLQGSYSAIKLFGIIYCFYFRWDTIESLQKSTLPTTKATGELASLLIITPTNTHTHTQTHTLH